jgi:flavorubredoxin
MKSAFKATRICDDVYWVGAVDWAVRDFHGYHVGRGTTYNAYLVVGDKIALIDTVKAGFADEMLARIASVIDPADIDYIVANHAEPDHSGALAETIRAVRPTKVFTSARGVEAFAQHFAGLGELTAVPDGGSIPLGNMTLTCLETRMCHWPESMVTWLPDRGVMFSQDAFGLHLASSERFDDELPLELIDDEAAKYYANILMPLATYIAKTLDRLDEAKLPIRILAPDHGPIRRTHIARIVDQYRRWSAPQRTRKAVVVYDTMWGSTDLMARAVGEGLAAGGSPVRLMPLSGTHRSDVAAELLDAGALVVASPTINNTIFPTLADVLCYVKGLKPRGLLGAVVGSFGWSGEAAKELTDLLTAMKIELVGEPIRSRFAPTDAVLAECYNLGQTVAGKLKEKAGA